MTTNERAITCPICTQSSTVTLEDAQLHLYVCAACQHPFSGLPQQEQEPYSEPYFDETHKRWFTHPDTHLFEKVFTDANALLGNTPIRLLDVGCGNGNFLKYLADKKTSADLSGIDLIQNADPRIHFYQGDFFATTFPSTYNVLTGLAVIEHVDDPRRFVQQTHELLDANGICMYMTVNSQGLLYRIARGLKLIGIRLGYDRLFSRHHLQHYTNQSLSKLFTTNGFTVLNVRNHGFPFAAIDVPAVGEPLEFILRIGVWVIFRVADLFNAGMLQTITCRKN